jgi:Fe-S-cluster containining protein
MSANLCEYCTAVCCRYVALPIETPEDKSDFDDIRWYLIHENISVFIEDDEWFINFHSPCRHLLPDHRCGIYETRPNICRKYTTENCDYHSGDYGWQEHFTAPEHLDAYVKSRSRKGGRKHKPASGSTRRPLPVLGNVRARRKNSGQQVDRRGIPLPRLP